MGSEQIQAAAFDVGARLGQQLSVAPGLYRFFRKEDCQAAVEVWGHCAGNNPSSPYGLLFAPLRPGEVPNPESMQLATKLGVVSGLSPSWRLAPGRDALILIGLTPPKHRYFSYLNYLFTRESNNYITPDPNLPILSQAFNGVPNQPDRRTFFASLGNGLSMNTLRTAKADNVAAAMVLIMTADAAFEELLRSEIEAVLKKSGLPADIVNSLPYPADWLKLGLDGRADDFMFLGRAALPEDRAKAAAYLDQPPVTVLRVYDDRQSTTDHPHTYAPLPAREQGWSEDYLRPALLALEDGVKRYFARRVKTSVKDVAGVKLEPGQGQLCMALNLSQNAGYNCAGDNPHTTYTVSSGRFDLDETPQTLIVAIGVNHSVSKGRVPHASPKATYTNISVYSADDARGLNSLTDDDFVGTARAFLDDIPIATAGRREAIARQDELYVVAFARDCTAVLGPEPTRVVRCVSLDDAELAKHQRALFVERAYMLPGGAIGPAYSEIVTPRFFAFSE